MTSDKERLAQRLHFDQGESPAEIARALQCSASTAGRLLVEKKASKPIARPKARGEKKVNIFACRRRHRLKANNAVECAPEEDSVLNTRI